MFDSILGFIKNFYLEIDGLSLSIFLINFIIFVFGKYIIEYLDISNLKRKPDEESKKKKLKTLQFINITLAVTYLLALFLDKEIFQSIILSGFTILVIYIINNILIRQIILFYGKEVETNTEKYFQESPTSEIFSLVLNTVSVIIGFFTILNIFDLNSVMQTGGVIGGALAFLGFTANNWSPDIIAGLQLLHSKRIKQDDVIIIKELENPVWIKTISLTEIKVMDLVTDNAIIIKASKFRDFIIENVSVGVTNAGKEYYLQFIELKIGYGTKMEDIEKLCIDAFNNIKTDILSYENGENSLINDKYKMLKRAFHGDTETYLEIYENGDHAVTYRFFYTIHRAKSIVKVRNILNKELYKLSEERNIGLNTPFTLTTIN